MKKIRRICTLAYKWCQPLWAGTSKTERIAFAVCVASLSAAVFLAAWWVMDLMDTIESIERQVSTPNRIEVETADTLNEMSEHLEHIEEALELH